MKYSQFLDELNTYAEKPFALFQQKLIFTKQTILGVRTPVLRALAKKYAAYIQEFLSFPDEYYEVTFIKLTMISRLPYHLFVEYLPTCVNWIDNWATCDSFRAKCIIKHKDEFLPVLQSIFEKGTEFTQRYVLVSLLAYYVNEPYLATVYEYLRAADCSKFYVHMACAWLTAEVVVKAFDFGIRILQDKLLPIRTHNKAIQKAVESYRLTQEQKERLRSLKIKS